MEKYKSDIIDENDLMITTNNRWEEDTHLRIVEVKYIPTGAIVSVEDKSQLRAYKRAIEKLEQSLLGINNISR